MRFRDMRNVCAGKDKRIAELEEALQFVLLACEAVDWELEDYNEAVFSTIKEKCKRTLDKQ